MRRGLFDMDEVTGRHLDWSLFRRFLALVRPFRCCPWLPWRVSCSPT
jgi:hypothetical protein